MRHMQLDAKMLQILYQFPNLLQVTNLNMVMLVDISAATLRWAAIN